MKRVLKWIGIILGVLLLLGVIAFFALNKSMPKGEEGPAAEALAQKMATAIDLPAWDTTAWVSWDFVGMHTFVWDKSAHLVQVNWGKNRVIFDPDTNEGMAWSEGTQLAGEEANKEIREAVAFFNNDSFWLNAPAKVFAPGTIRKLVKDQEGGDALLVTYQSGGSTPGDSYLWFLDENGRPVKWQMWVSVIPIGGVELTWDNWSQLYSGAWLSSSHKGASLNLEIKDIKAGKDYRSIGLAEDPFAALRR